MEINCITQSCLAKCKSTDRIVYYCQQIYFLLASERFFFMESQYKVYFTVGSNILLLKFLHIYIKKISCWMYTYRQINKPGAHVHIVLHAIMIYIFFYLSNTNYIKYILH